MRVNFNNFHYVIKVSCSILVPFIRWLCSPSLYSPSSHICPVNAWVMYTLSLSLFLSLCVFHCSEFKKQFYFNYSLFISSFLSLCVCVVSSLRSRGSAARMCVCVCAGSRLSRWFFFFFFSFPSPSAFPFLFIFIHFGIFFISLSLWMLLLLLLVVALSST